MRLGPWSLGIFCWIITTTNIKPNDKPTVIALREIAEGHITPAILEEVEQPAAEEFMQPEVADDIMPMRGISIGD